MAGPPVVRSGRRRAGSRARRPASSSGEFLIGSRQCCPRREPTKAAIGDMSTNDSSVLTLAQILSVSSLVMASWRSGYAGDGKSLKPRFDPEARPPKSYDVEPASDHQGRWVLPACICGLGRTGPRLRCDADAPARRLLPSRLARFQHLTIGVTWHAAGVKAAYLHLACRALAKRVLWKGESLPAPTFPDIRGHFRA